MRAVGTLVEKLKRGETFENRARNPYIAEALEYTDILLTSSELESLIDPAFAPGGDRRLVVEIGSYLGKNLLEMGEACPDLDFLGVDITYKRVVRIARKIRSSGCNNLRVALCEGTELLGALPDRSLSGICLFFPDPWTKKRQAKNRIVSPRFFEILEAKLRAEGFFWFKTDQEPYFEVAREIASERGWVCDWNEAVPPELGGGEYRTVFEELFLSQGAPTFRCVFRQNH